MAYDVSVRLGVDGEKAFRSSIDAINANLKSMGSELKAVTAQFAKNADSEEALTTKNQVLAKSVAATKDKIGVLDKQLERQAEKLRELGRAADEAAAAYGENSDEALRAQNAYNNQAKAVAKLQTQLNGAKAELAGMEDAVRDNQAAIDGLGREVEDAGEAMDQAGQNAHNFGERLRSGIATAAKVAGASLAAISAATAALTKSVIGDFSGYEQLVGGIATLFKSSAGQVQEYAQTAFKTAGLSANEYMDTVTSFSASLLQGLGGDTAKAADLANLAITDMSDNANKMGTDMAAIQYAYQGFAKQNYTMLDNLKLGYGGTQEEMIRLINDSGVLNEEIKSLDNVTFDQMIQAIHEVQTQIGITGTTAKEAEETIQGSTAAMKSSWENLMIGLASGDQDMSQLVSNFTSSVETAAQNVLPRVGVILQGIGPMIGEFLKQSFVSQLPEMVLTGKDFVVSLVSGITEGVPNLQETVNSVAGNISQYIRDNTPAFISSGLDLLAGLASSIREGAGVMVDAGIQLVTSLAQGLADSFPTIIEKLPGIVSDIAGGINDNAPKILTAGVNIIVTLGKGLIQAIPSLIKNIPAIIKAIVDVFTAFSWINLGGKIMTGLGNGIKGMASFIKNSVQSIQQIIKTKFNELPSLLVDVGKNMIKQLWQGITSMGQWLRTQLGGFISNAISAVTGGGNKTSSSGGGTGRRMAAPALAAAEPADDDFPWPPKKPSPSPAPFSANGLIRSLSDAEAGTRMLASVHRVRQDVNSAVGGVAGYYSARQNWSGNLPPENGGSGVDYQTMVSAFREAMEGMGVTLDGRKAGTITAVHQSNMGRAFGTA